MTPVVTDRLEHESAEMIRTDRERASKLPDGRKPEKIISQAYILFYIKTRFGVNGK